MNNVQRTHLAKIIDSKVQKANSLVTARYDELVKAEKERILEQAMPNGITKFNQDLELLMKLHKKSIIEFDVFVRSSSALTSSNTCVSVHEMLKFLLSKSADKKKAGISLELSNYGYHRDRVLDLGMVNALEEKSVEIRKEIESSAELMKFELYMGSDKDEALKMLKKFDEKLTMLLK
ncbi:MAG: hypothetical protein JRL30_28225 [Deltaproteobacteria bacterium]|nr:hypothetical protein [Deltaproteobacteria bacterium]